ncbi:ABC transporter permease subunit [Nitriliruptoraceae bacterium ZYF776]|nr:ABC transporter permease subunit [Profundirhabdus halotolerans]
MSTPAVTAPTPPRSGALGRGVRASLPAVVFAAAVVGTWQLAVQVLEVPSFILPSPAAIVAVVPTELPRVLSASWLTVQATVIGLAVGVAWGVALALVVARFRTLSAPLLAVAVVCNSAPIVALAPIFNNWLGVTSIASKAAVGAVMAFFPVFVNVTRGLTSASALHLDVLHAAAASPRQVARLVRLPTALPYLFSALKLAATLAVIGVIVTEYFGGPQNTLGVYIANQAALPRFAEAWVGIAVASALGFVLFAAVVVAERLALPWQPNRD